MKKNKRTFGEIVRLLEPKNSEMLMLKARRANRIAKFVRGEARRVAYRAKASALSALLTKLPERIDVRSDLELTDFVVIGLKQTRGGLHFRRAELPSERV